MAYLRRIIDDELDELMPHLPAICLEGPRGIGKTATASRRAQSVHHLDDPRQSALIHAEPELSLRGDSPVLIDEWQLEPTSWDLVRRAVDLDPTGGRFLLTGSAAPAQLPQHSGAGRIVTLRMWPMTLPERGLQETSVSLRGLLSGAPIEISGTSKLRIADYVEEILSTGLPAIRTLPVNSRRKAIDGYMQRALDRDLHVGNYRVRRRATLLAWLRAYAAATSTTASFESIRDAATSGETEKPAKETAMAYRDLLASLWLIDDLPAWVPNGRPISRLVLPPKHHLADPGLAARLLGLTEISLPTQPALLGTLFESLVTQQVRVLAQACGATVHHLRTKSGEREIDLIVEGDDAKVVALEVKLTGLPTDHDVRHLHWLRAKLGDQLADAAIVTSGPYAYRRPDGIAVVPAALLGI